MASPPAVLARLCAAALFAYCSYAICRTPLLPLYARELGAGPSLIGLIMGASTLTGIVVKLPAGALSDLLGRRRLLMAGALVFAVMPFTYLSVPTIALLVTLRFLHGSATAIFGPVASASLSDVAPPASRGAWLSTYSTAQGIGQAIGPVIAGTLMSGGRIDLAFVAAGSIGLVAPFIVAGWSTPARAATQRASWRQFRQGVVEVAGDRLILVTSTAQAALFMLNGMLNAFLPLYGREVLGLAPAAIGWLFAAQTLTILAVRPVVGRLSDRIDRRLVIVAGLITGGCAIFVLPLASATATVVGLILVYAAGVAMTTAAASAFITDVTRQARYGAAHGVFGTIYDIGDAAGPIVAGMLVARVGFAPTFQCVSAVTIATAAVFARVARVRPNERVNPSRPTREAPQSDRPPTRGEPEDTRPLRLRR